MASVTLELTIDDIPGYKTGEEFLELAQDAFAERHRMPPDGDKEEFFAAKMIDYIAGEIAQHQVYAATQSARAAAKADNDRIENDVVKGKRIKLSKKR